MGGVRVVTDSSCDLPAELAAEHGIDVVPLTIRFGDQELVLVYVAKRLKEALRIEELLTAAGIDYVVEPDKYRGGLIFVSERIGAFVYVDTARRAATHRAKSRGPRRERGRILQGLGRPYGAFPFISPDPRRRDQRCTQMRAPAADRNGRAVRASRRRRHRAALRRPVPRSSPHRANRD